MPLGMRVVAERPRPFTTLVTNVSRSMACENARRTLGLSNGAFLTLMSTQKTVSSGIVTSSGEFRTASVSAVGTATMSSSPLLYLAYATVSSSMSDSVILVRVGLGWLPEELVFARGVMWAVVTSSELLYS